MGECFLDLQKHSIHLSVVSSPDPPDISRQRLCPQQSWWPEGASGQMTWTLHLSLGLLGLRLFQPGDSGFCRPGVTAGGNPSNMLLEKRGVKKETEAVGPQEATEAPRGGFGEGKGLEVRTQRDRCLGIFQQFWEHTK